MTPYVKQGRWVTAWLAQACLGLLQVSPLSAQDPKLQVTLKGHAGAVVAVAFSPDSKTLASASYDGTLKLWDMTTGKERATLGEYRGCLGCVAFSSDGKTLVSVSDDETVRLWHMATGKEQATFQGHTEADKEATGAIHSAMSVAFSPNGKTLAAASYDTTVKVRDVATGKERATLQGTEAVWSVAFSPDGKNLASAGGTISNAPGELKLWDVATGK